VTANLTIGYSFWGFLGNGVVDTPDGGRSHRRTLLQGLLASGHRLALLQSDRDRSEASDPMQLASDATWAAGLPDIDALMLEWRWLVAGRNDPASRDHAGYTPDLDRQRQLVAHYTLGLGTPTMVWDKDLTLAADDPIRAQPNVQVLEAALYPGQGARQLLFPVADDVLDGRLAAPGALSGRRELPLVYVGNQYGRDDHFDRWFAPLASQHPHSVYGKWPFTSAWPQVRFAGRVPFAQVETIYREALATVALLPPRYRARGQMTQRLAEAVLAGCLTIVPSDIRGAERFAPTALIASSTEDAARLMRSLLCLDTDQLGELDAQALEHLQRFRASAQTDRLLAYLDNLLR
jgi:hypothetical protein